MSDYTGIFIEYHILQSFPVTCLNRDGVGEPKSAIVGGVPRARVSSQCWKRQVRLYAKQLGVELGIRTKKLEELLLKGLQEKGAAEDKAADCAAKMAAALTKDTLLFLSDHEVKQLVEYAASKNFALPDLSKDKEKNAMVKNCMSQTFKQADGLDIALFGRMVAQAPEINVNAAASFAHAISTHACRQEFDYFTALDDLQTEPGSGHLGTLEYNSATYYRYVTLDLGQLAANLGLNGDEDLDKAIEVFTRSHYAAVPSARQTTMTGTCLWDHARVLVRKGPRMQVAFDKPVRAQGDGWLAPSIAAMDEAIERNEKRCGSMYGKIADLTFGRDDDVSIDSICSKLVESLASAR